MSKVIGFLFFLLLLAAIAFISLKDMRPVAELSTSGEITGISWQLLVLGGNAVPPGSAIRLQFDQDGKLTGHGGCNGFFGDYRHDGNGIEIGPIGATRMSCPEPEMTLENRFLEALARTVLAESRAARLTLSDSGGTVLAVLQPAAVDTGQNP